MTSIDEMIEHLQKFSYVLNDDESSYCITSIGDDWNWGDECIIVPSIHNEKPVTRIGAFAIPNFEWIKSISIPKTIMEIHPDAFCGSGYFEKIVIAEENPIYHSFENCIINTKTKELIVGCSTSIIPADGSVSIIGENAFQYCDNFQDIYIPNGIVDVKDASFLGCRNLRTIVLEKSIMHIGKSAFAKCENLKTIIYNGTYEEWTRILIEENNDFLLGAEKIFL